MKSIIFQKLNYLTFFLIFFFRIIGYRIFFIKISPILRNKNLIKFLKKYDIFWFNYQDFELDDVKVNQMNLYLKIAGDISNKFTEKFYSKKMEKVFISKDYLKTIIEFNIKNYVMESVEVVEIYNYLKKRENIKLLWANNDKIIKFVLENYKINNLNKINFNFFSLNFFFLPLFIYKFIKININQFIKSYYKKKIIKKKFNYLRKIQSVFFPHEMFTRGLYKKDFFYFKDENHVLFPKNILHVEWKNIHLNSDSIKYYNDNQIKYIFWEKIYSLNLIKSAIKFIVINLNLFFNLIIWDFFFFKIILFSFLKIQKTNLFFNDYKDIKYLFSGHSDLFPPEILVEAKKRNIISISLEDRIVLSKWSNRVIFDYYFVSGGTSKNYIINKNYRNIKNQVLDGCLIKSNNIQKISNNKTSEINCLITDFHSDDDWYENGNNSINNKRLNYKFYDLVLSLSNEFKDVNFLIKSKNYNWLNQEYFVEIVQKFKQKANVEILVNQNKWTPESSSSFCDFAFGLHSSLLDEIFCAGKPIIIYDRGSYPSKIFDYGREVTFESYSDITNQFSKLLLNFNDYNSNLDKLRSKHFFKINERNYFNNLDKIINRKFINES
jgi:hypothetical protein